MRYGGIGTAQGFEVPNRDPGEKAHTQLNVESEALRNGQGWKHVNDI